MVVSTGWEVQDGTLIVKSVSARRAKVCYMARIVHAKNRFELGFICSSDQR
jgi:hypothetical protein